MKNCCLLNCLSPTPILIIFFCLLCRPCYSQQDIGYDKPLVNQAGYNLNEAKRFVYYGAKDGTKFNIVRLHDSMVVHKGVIKDYAGDFSDLNPKGSTSEYVVETEDKKRSVPFWIADHLIENLSSKLAYEFFIDVRGSNDPVHSNEDKVYGGGPSRDGGAFGLETTFETMLYASNPALFDRWTNEMPSNKTPDLIDLILWHGEFAYNHVAYNGPIATRHGSLGYEGKSRMNYDYWNTLDQLAAVCAAYHSFLKPYLSKETYQKYRKVCLEKWEDYDRNKVVRYWTYSSKWVDSGYQEFNEQGNAFGQSVFSNLFMYLSEKNEPDGQPEKFLKWAQDGAKDIIKNWDFNNPRHMWWIRNAEHITPQALTFFLLVAPDKAPPGTLQKLAQWRDFMKQKTNNFWQYRVHSDTEWAHPKTKELGGAPALGGSMFGVAYLLKDKALRGIGWSQVNFVFGLNPLGAHLSNKSDERLAIGGYWAGVENGWPEAHPSGYGQLGKVRGTLDGSPLDSQFPRSHLNGLDSSAGSMDKIGNKAYATEGWAISNRGWLATLTFSTLGSTSVKVFNENHTNEIHSVKEGQNVVIELLGALNQDWYKRETAWVEIKEGKSKPYKIQVTETDENTGVFLAKYTVPKKQKSITKIKVSYGYWGFEKNASLIVKR